MPEKYSLFSTIGALPLAVAGFLERALDFRGVESRKTFWLGYSGMTILAVSLAGLLFSGKVSAMDGYLFVSLITMYVVTIFSAIIRRLRDAGVHFSVAFLPLLPFVLENIYLFYGDGNQNILLFLLAACNLSVLVCFVFCLKKGKA